MTAITVLKFDTESGAENAFGVVQNLAKQQILTLQETAIVTWPRDKEKPKIQKLINLADLGQVDDAFWGMLFGIIFFIPLRRMDAGAATDGLSDSFVDVGIADDFIESVREIVTKGTSALFLMTSDVVLDSVPEAMQDMDFELVSSRLSREQEAQLKAAFVHE